MDMEMSMDIIEMARDLGRALQADEKYQRYVNATLENDKDQVLQDLIGKFNTLRVDINREISKSEKDQEKIARLDSEFKTTYRLIMSRHDGIQCCQERPGRSGTVYQPDHRRQRQRSGPR